jgi:hypothetical protein
LREKVLKDLASRAATDAGFLKQARRDLQGALAGFAYELTLEELRLVEYLRRRAAAMSDEQLARVLASGLRGRTGTTRRLTLVGCVTSTGHARFSRRWSIPTGMEGSR